MSHRAILPVFALVSLSACASEASPVSARAPSASTEAETQTAKLPQGYELVDYAQDAQQLCQRGDWCLYGAFMLNTDYEDMGGGTPNTDFFDTIQGTVVEFAQSFNISLYDQLTFPDSQVHTVYEISKVRSKFVCLPENFCDLLTADMDGGNSSGMYLYYDWYTYQTSEIPGIFYGSEYGFEIYQPVDAMFDYSPDELGNSGYFPEVTDNKGQAFAVLRRYDTANFPAMTDFATGDAFFYLVHQ